MKYNPPFVLGGNPDAGAPYVDRNTPGATSGSVPPAAAIEQPQREIAHVIDFFLGNGTFGSGQDETDNEQLRKAMQFGVTGHSDIPVLGLTPNPPSAPGEGARYVVLSPATGEWVGQENKIAIYTGGAWAFASPLPGLQVNVWAGTHYIVLYWTGSLWQEWLATESARGPVELATDAETKAATGEGVVRAKQLAPYIIRPDPGVDPVLWIRPDGDDNNDGSANTAAKALRTLTAARDMAQDRYQLAGRKLYMRLGAPGTYAAAYLTGISGEVIIEGDKANRANYAILGSSAVIGTNVTFRGVAPELPTTPSQHTLQVASGGTIILDGAFFKGEATSVWAHLYAAAGGTVQVAPATGGIPSVFFASSAQAAMRAEGAGASISCRTGSEIGFSISNYTYSGATVIASENASVNLALAAITGGPVTGKRYEATLNGVINTGGKGVNAIPGTIAGTVSTGGQYA